MGQAGGLERRELVKPGGDQEAAGERRAVRNLLNGRNAAYAGGTAAALAAGAVGVALWANRRKLSLAS